MVGTFGDAGELDWGDSVEVEVTPDPVAVETPPVTPAPAAPAAPTPAAATPPTPAAPAARGGVPRQPVGVPSRPVAASRTAVAGPSVPVPVVEEQPVAPTEAVPVEQYVPAQPAPAPVVEQPAPVVEQPAPVAEHPAPAPAPAPVVEQSAPVVEQPAPAPVVEQPAPEPVVEQPVPAPVVEQPAPAVVFEQPVPVQSEQAFWETSVPVPVVEEQPGVPVGVVPDVSESEPVGRKRGRGKKGVKKVSGGGKRGVGLSAARGGRGQVLVLRGLVWVVLGVLLLGGLKNVLSPNENLSIPEIADRVSAETGTKGFPLAPAAAFTSRFVGTYLTFDPESYEARQAALKVYAVEAAEGDYGVDPKKVQSVLAGPFLVDSEVEDKHRATLTLAALLSDQSWVYVAVPVYAADGSTFVIAGAPGFVSAPALAVLPSAEGRVEVDTDLSDELSVDLVPGFLKAWAGSNSVELARYTTSSPSANARVGLRGVVSLGSVDEVKFEAVGGKKRQGVVTVVWQTGSGSFVQQYRVWIEQAADGRWSVDDIRGAVFSSSGTSDSPEPSPSPSVSGGVDSGVDPAEGTTDE